MTQPIDQISLAALRVALAANLQKCFADWSRMHPAEWAEEVYRLPNGRRFRWDYAPYAKGMHASIFDPRTIETIFQLYSRGLKSTVVLLAIGYIIDQAPRSILSLWPTNSQAEKFSKDILTGELFDTTPCMNFLGSANKKRTGSNTLLHKLFPGGLIDLFGANAPGDMRRAKGSFLYADEIDAIQTTETDEGDQLAIFSKRGDEFPDTIRVFASYPSLKGHSRINSKLEDSDYNEWFSTCVVCGGEPFVMHRKHIVYDEANPAGARLECPRCHNFLTDAQRYEMAHRQGFDNWKPRNPFRGKRGFHANAMLWPHPVDVEKFPGGWLQQMAQQEIDAKRSDNPARSLKVLVNTVDAEPFEPESSDQRPPEWKPIFDRREDYTDVPERALVITGAADLQLNRIEVAWYGWGRNEEAFGLDHTVIDGDIRDAGTWGLLRRELQRKFRHACGAELPFSLFFIDGGKWGDLLHRFLGELSKNPLAGVSGKIRAVKGFGAWPHPIISDYRSIAKTLKGYHVGTWQIKSLINRRIVQEPREQEEAQIGLFHWNKRFSEAFFQQLCTAKATVTYDGSEEVLKYLNEDHLRDEGLDLTVYNYAAFSFRKWNFDLIEADILARAKPVEAKKPEPQIRPRSNWVGGFTRGF